MDDEVADPKGLSRLSWKHLAGKRKEIQHKKAQPRAKKRRKMKFDTITEDWGNGIGEDMDKFEEQETARWKFLKDGETDKKAGTQTRQSTLRVWTGVELQCRELLNLIIDDCVTKEIFMSSLKEYLVVAWIANQEPLDVPDVITQGPLVQAAVASGGEEETGPEGWKRDEPEEVRRARTTGGTDHPTSQVEKENLPEGPKTNQDIRKMFRAKAWKNDISEIKALEMEERFVRKKRQELSWKAKKDHHSYLRWAKEWLMDGAVPSAVHLGSQYITNIVQELLCDMVDGLDENTRLIDDQLEIKADCDFEMDRSSKRIKLDSGLAMDGVMECGMSSCVDVIGKNTLTLGLDMDQGLATGGDGSKQLAIHYKQKKVWGRKSNGLYGWKAVQGPQKSGNPKENKHTLRSPKPSPKATKSVKQTAVLQNWLLTPNIVLGGGEVRGEVEGGLQSQKVGKSSEISAKSELSLTTNYTKTFGGKIPVRTAENPPKNYLDQ